MAAHHDKQYHKIAVITAALQVKYRSVFIFFSPIVHSHPVSLYMLEKDKHDPTLWLNDIDLPFIEQWVDELWIVKLDGWDKSDGMNREITTALDTGVPVYYVDPVTLEVSSYEC